MVSFGNYSDCFKIPEAGHVSAISQNSCSGVKPAARTGFDAENKMRYFDVLAVILLSSFLLFLFFCSTGCRTTSQNKTGLFSTPSPTSIHPQSPAQNPADTGTQMLPAGNQTLTESRLPVTTTTATTKSPPFFSGNASISNSTTPTLPLANIANEPSDFDNRRYEAFRPIIPNHVADSPVVLPNDPPNTTTVFETAATQGNPKIDSVDETQELKKQIARLEQELKEAKTPPPNPFPTSPPTPLPTPTEETKINSPQPADSPSKPTEINDSRQVLIFDIDGVTTTKDEKNAVRISIVDSLLFVGTSWKLTPSAEEVLRRVTTEIRAAYPDAEIDIEGHTDNLDIDPKNPTQKHDIASIKAGVVMDYCVKTLRCDPAKMKKISCGAKHPAADNATAEGRAKNNRIDIVIP
ncbi:MAG: OmpA family protein [Planctomycetaceae bacterium]|jgi:flagellar motor protein MotB|nr:OmpA family protein [Planctomycetaceae bacterium]